MIPCQPYSIFLLCFNGQSNLHDFFSSLSVYSNLPQKIYLCDNGSDVPITLNDICVLSHLVEIIRLDINRGIAHAFNYCIQNVIKDEYIIWFNDDLIHIDSFLPDKLIRSLNTNNTVLADPIVYSYPDFSVWSAGAYTLPLLNLPRFNRLRPLDLVFSRFSPKLNVGCVLAFRRSYVVNLGCLSTKFYFGYEDLDLSLRAINSGLRVNTIMNAYILHKVSSTTRKDKNYHSISFRSLITFQELSSASNTIKTLRILCLRFLFLLKRIFLRFF